MKNKTSQQFIYKIVCTTPKKVYFYIGRSQNVKKRFAVHMQQLESGMHCNDYMQNVYNQHGPESFSVTIIADLGRISEKEAGKVEEKYLKLCWDYTMAGFSGQQKAETKQNKTKQNPKNL